MRITILLLVILLSPGSWGQEAPDTLDLSLQQAVELSLKNNYNSRKSSLEIEKALQQKWEIISQGLPQISGNIDYQNFLKQPVTLIPGEIAGGAPGTFVPVSFGTKHSMTGTATWTQLIFDGSYIVGVQSARTLLQISKNAKVKTDLEVKKAVINAYGNVLMAEESVQILQENLQNILENLHDTQKIFENGLAEQEDVEQLKITRLQLENNLNRNIRMLDVSYQVLNMALGLPIETPVRLTEDIETLVMDFFDLELLEKNISLEENIDVRIARNTAKAADIFVRLEKAKALPSLHGFLNFGMAGYSNDFTFLEDDQDYFQQSILGISMHIPVFSSGMRASRTRQKELEYQQALLELEQTKNQVKLEIESARSNYRFSLENYQVTQESLDLAIRINKKNEIKFFEGLASSFELSEAQRQLYNAQQNLLKAMLEVISAKVELEHVLNTDDYTTHKE